MLENIQQLKIASAPTTSSPTPSTSVDSAPIARSTSRTIPLAIAPQPHDARRASEGDDASGRAWSAGRRLKTVGKSLFICSYLARER